MLAFRAACTQAIIGASTTVFRWSEINYDTAQNQIVGLDIDTDTTLLKVERGFDQVGNLLYGVTGIASVNELSGSENGVTLGFLVVKN